MIKHLVVGLGEIGTALVQIFKAEGEDKFKNIHAPEGDYKFMHIAFPYVDDSFLDEVRAYQEKFNPKYTVIHSTVPIGTSDKLEAVHSPVRGVHPHLKDSILTFKKFVGGKYAFEVSEEFKKYRIKTLCTLHARNTEALKLMSTTQYGVFIMLNKEIYNWCKENEVDFNIVYTLANETYNEGYTKMFRPEVMRPYLKYFGEEKLGGHCIIPNCELLEKYSPFESAKDILEKNATLRDIRK